MTQSTYICQEGPTNKLNTNPLRLPPRLTGLFAALHSVSTMNASGAPHTCCCILVVTCSSCPSLARSRLRRKCGRETGGRVAKSCASTCCHGPSSSRDTCMMHAACATARRLPPQRLRISLTELGCRQESECERHGCGSPFQAPSLRQGDNVGVTRPGRAEPCSC